MKIFTTIRRACLGAASLCLGTRLNMYVLLNGAGQLRPRCMRYDRAVALRVAVEGRHSPALHSLRNVGNVVFA